jgi:hypothetical protein
MNHQLNQSLVQYIRAESKIFKQTFDMNLITAKRAIDRNPMPSRRAFRGMAGLAVLYPSVVDYIGQAIKDALSALYGDLGGYPVNLCR